MSLIESFLVNMDKKGARLLNFFKRVDAHKHEQVLDALLKIQTETCQSTTGQLLRGSHTDGASFTGSF